MSIELNKTNFGRFFALAGGAITSVYLVDSAFESSRMKLNKWHDLFNLPMNAQLGMVGFIASWAVLAYYFNELDHDINYSWLFPLFVLLAAMMPMLIALMNMGTQMKTNVVRMFALLFMVSWALFSWRMALRDTQDNNLQILFGSLAGGFIVLGMALLFRSRRWQPGSNTLNGQCSNLFNIGHPMFALGWVFLVLACSHV